MMMLLLCWSLVVLVDVGGAEVYEPLQHVQWLMLPVMVVVVLLLVVVVVLVEVLSMMVVLVDASDDDTDQN